MNQHAAANYLRTKVLTATPEQLQLMLYDGAIRFTEQARTAVGEKKYDVSYDLLVKAQRIILELQVTLKHKVAPETCAKLTSLYNFIYRKLVEANTAHDDQAFADALQLMKYQRETWMMLMQKISQNKAAAVARTIDMPAPSARMEASISFHG